MRRRAVFTMGVIMCFCMFLSLSMQAALADIDETGPSNAPVRIHRKELRSRHHEAHHANTVDCDGLGGARPLPPAPAGALSFFTIGDWGVRGMKVGGESQMSVARGMSCAARRAPIKFVATLGDNFYGAGVSSVDDQQFRYKFETVYDDASLQVPWFPALGDHDHCGDVRAQADYSKKSERWTMPREYYQQWIDFEGGVAQLVFVDWVRLEGKFTERQDDRRFYDRLRENQAGAAAAEAHWEWLRETLRRGDPTWRVVIGHRPLISVSSRAERDDAAFPAEGRTRKALRELMEASKVDLWINGHDHTVQVACSDAGGAATRFVTAGVGGYDLHALVDSSRWHPETVYANNTYHGFAAHRITPDAITTYFLDERGDVQHEFAIRKGETRCPE